MKKWILFIIIGFVFMNSSTSFANHTNNWENLDIIADQTLQFVKQEKYDDAKKLLSYFSDQFSKLTVDEDSTIKMDDIRIINSTIAEANLSLKADSNEYEEKVHAFTKLRLAIDAIESEHQPLWTEMESSVMTSFQSLKEAVNSKNNQQFQANLNQFLSKYEMIYPSIRIDLNAEDSLRIDSYVSFLEQYRQEILTNESRMNHMEMIEDELLNMFKQVKKDDADPSLIWVMISTGSAIILTLTYVAWRKYKGDKEKRKSRNTLND